LAKQANAASIPFTPFNRNMLLFFACISTAAKTSTKVGHAIKYFKAVKPIP
jgi:hypothetical protein